VPVPPAARWWRWLAPAFVAAAILVITSWPTPPMPPGQWDKVIHASAYATLGLATGWAARPGSLRAWLRLAIAVSAFGALDELHQRWIPGRSADPFDWLADTSGGAIGLAIMTARRTRQETE
jgi:VanZ family protein